MACNLLNPGGIRCIPGLAPGFAVLGYANFRTACCIYPYPWSKVIPPRREISGDKKVRVSQIKEVNCK